MASIIILDTETTGLKVEDGHRVIEIGCVEILDRRPTGRRLHHLLNPEREVDAGATQVHGFTLADLEDKPRFSEVAEEFLAFIRGQILVIHNAPFDIGFLNAELARVGGPKLETVVAEVVDSLRMARDMFPVQRNSLDALCARLGVSNAHRKLHGALLDAEILADVYLAMTRGQDSLNMLADDPAPAPTGTDATEAPRRWGPLVLAEPSPEELEAHQRMVEAMSSGGRAALWQTLAPRPPLAMSGESAAESGV